MGKICSQEYFIQKAVIQDRRGDKEFPDKQTLKVFVTTKQALQKVLKGTLSGAKRPKSTKTRKEQKTSPETPTLGNTMALNSYLLIITLNVNGLNSSTKSHRV